MEKELNIAAILKEKPVGTKLYSPCCGVCTKGNYGNSERPITLYLPNRVLYHLLGNGKEYETGEIMVYPSKQMRDWSKFAWKKGDVLIAGADNFCIFDSWANDDYTEFYAKFVSNRYEGEVCKTSVWTKETKENIIKQYISNIEEIKCGKLNLDTLRIEKPQFKDGDIVFVEDDRCIVIFKRKHIVSFDFYACLSDNEVINYDSFFTTDKLRPATDSEKQQLFSALEKEGKAWDAEKKAIVDLAKKCEFKPMDWCLMRDFGEKWKLCQFAFKEEESATDHAPYNAVGGNWFNECIPYNDQTAHLLGTTDDWEGGE